MITLQNGFFFQLTLEYKEKRKNVDDMKDELQRKIAEYSKMAESGRKIHLFFKKPKPYMIAHHLPIGNVLLCQQICSNRF